MWLLHVGPPSSHFTDEAAEAEGEDGDLRGQPGGGGRGIRVPPGLAAPARLLLCSIRQFLDLCLCMGTTLQFSPRLRLEIRPWQDCV